MTTLLLPVAFDSARRVPPVFDGGTVRGWH